jgi:hypothetical protein
MCVSFSILPSNPDPTYLRMGPSREKEARFIPQPGGGLKRFTSIDSPGITHLPAE